MYSKLGQKIHRLRIKVLTDRKLQVILYSVAAIIIILLSTLLITSSLFKEEHLVRHSIKACYNKNNVAEENIYEKTYTTEDNFVKIFYAFQQKCYRRMIVDYKEEGNNINIYLTPTEMDDDCLCDSEFTAKIGPLKNKDYTINIIKKTEIGNYVVSSENISIVN
jgi:hypothetical protein